MTETPEQAAAAEQVKVADSLEELREIAGRLLALDQTLARALQLTDVEQMILVAEHMLNLHVDFARAWRTWLVRRPLGVPPFAPRSSDRMSC